MITATNPKQELALLVWNRNVSAPAKGHGPLVARRRRDEAVILVDLERGVAQAVVVRWNRVWAWFDEGEVIVLSNFCFFGRLAAVTRRSGNDKREQRHECRNDGKHVAVWVRL
jgi:hypothetical protein